MIQKPGQGGAVSSVIVSQIGANNRTAGQVQSEVEFAPAAAYSLDFMETAAELSPDGDIIEHGRKLFRVQTVKKWAGFWEVLATAGNTGD